MEQENIQEISKQADGQPPQVAAPLGEGAYPFRGVAFGGFARQDVLNYLKKTQEANRQELQTLQEELDSVRAQYESERQRAQESERERDEMVRGAAELGQTLARVREKLSETESALEQSRREKADLQAHAEQLQAELEALRPQAEAYAQLRERTATIELNAHAHAQTIVDQAQRESALVREAYTEWAKEMHAEYQDLREDVNLTFGKAAQELERICRALERTTEEMDLHEEEIQSFLQQVELGELEDEAFA